MTHLLALSIGPVQELIAAARRTRDLWFGSKMLSDLSHAAAKSVADQGGKLIFPASLQADNVANVILAELPSGDPSIVAARAKDAVKTRWRRFAEEARTYAEGVIRTAIWNDQVDDVIEFYAAWVQGTENYAEDRDRVMRLLSGRKNCRDFPPAKGRGGVPKSSLDGQRETVLTDPKIERWPEKYRRKLRVREGEQLDVIGLVKRVTGGTERFPSVSRIAADPWVRGNHDRLGDVKKACEVLSADVIRELDTAKHPQFEPFPFEGTAVYKSRHHELIEETEITKDELKPLQEALAKLPEPEPYLAVLFADGDRMGEAIRKLKTADNNRDFSEDLAGFAAQAKKIVDEHNGVLVYAGGDDVRAFLPVDRCLACARELHDKFVKLFGEYKNEKDKSPTLSVGIAIGHFLENLEDLLNFGRAAEKDAKKPDRDGLAVHLHKRGGSPIRVRSSWTDAPNLRLKEFANLLQLDAISRKLAYDLRKLADLYDDKRWQGSVEAIWKDVLRVIRDKQPRNRRSEMPRVEKLLKDVKDAASLRRFVDELLVARQICRANEQANKPPTPTHASAVEEVAS